MIVDGKIPGSKMVFHKCHFSWRNREILRIFVCYFLFIVTVVFLDIQGHTVTGTKIQWWTHSLKTWGLRSGVDFWIILVPTIPGNQMDLPSQRMGRRLKQPKNNPLNFSCQLLVCFTFGFTLRKPKKKTSHWMSLDSSISSLPITLDLATSPTTGLQQS